jgi:ubiquitin-like-conjugating enzyme ATG10
MGSDKVIVNSLLYDGTLSSIEFSDAASVFADKWKRFNPNMPPWTWVSPQKIPGLVSNQVEGYLSLENFCIPKSIELDNGEVNGSCNCDDEELIDDATLVQLHLEERHNYNFHIVYCNSYRVPVLYFRPYSSDGHPLSFDEIKKGLPLYSSKTLSGSKWTFITQEEHPYLNMPWYKLHPCGTREWMKLLLLGDGGQAKQRVTMEQYLISWISVVGQVVGFKTSLEMSSDL